MLHIKRVYIYKDDKQAIIEMNTFEYCENRRSEWRIYIRLKH